MKKVLTALLALAVLLTGMTAAADDVRNVFHFVLFEIVENDDPSAFVITTDATDMHGEGFTYGFRI